MKIKPWIIKQSTPDQRLKLINSIWYDYIVKRMHYEYYEFLFRFMPGKFGISLRAIILKKFFRKCGNNIVIWPGVIIKYPDKIEIGENVSIANNCIIQGGGGIRIGDNTMVGPGAKIWSVNHLFKDQNRTINTQGYEGLPVFIGNDCWIGTNSFIKPGSILPDGCVLLPGTILGKMKIPEYSVITGNPAKVLGPRNRVGAMQGWGQN